MKKEEIDENTGGLGAKYARFVAEAKKNPKQAVVAGVILMVAVLLLLLVLGGDKKEKSAPAVKALPAVKEVVVETKEVVAKPEPKVEAEVAAPTPVVEPDEPKEPAVEAEPIAKETPAAEAFVPTVEEAVEEAPADEESVSKEVIKIEPQNVVLTFTATAEKDFTYQVFYTVVREVWFDASHVIDYEGKAGTQKYSIVLPEKSIYRIRLDFGSEPGTVTIKDIYVTGSQVADLNDFSKYELNQLDKSTVNKDGSLTFVSHQADPYIAYREALQEE